MVGEVEQVEDDHFWNDDSLEEVYRVVLQLQHRSSYNKNVAEAGSAMEKVMNLSTTCISFVHSINAKCIIFQNDPIPVLLGPDIMQIL